MTDTRTSHKVISWMATLLSFIVVFGCAAPSSPGGGDSVPERTAVKETPRRG